MGYNTWEGGPGHSSGDNWASDLIVECDVQVEKAQGKFALELSRGPDRFQANFDLAEGTCTLFRLVEGKEPEKLKSQPTRMKGKGTYQVRFANVDDRLTVWLDGRLIFGDGVPYDMPRNKPLAPTKENDLDRPVSIGSGRQPGHREQAEGVPRHLLHVLPRRQAGQERRDRARSGEAGHVRIREKRSGIMTYYVQPKHFLCLGDNSPESSDGRSWGLVPQRLLLGRALLVYYPFNRAGRIR